MDNLHLEDKIINGTLNLAFMVGRTEQVIIGTAIENKNVF